MSTTNGSTSRLSSTYTDEQWQIVLDADAEFRRQITKQKIPGVLALSKDVLALPEEKQEIILQILKETEATFFCGFLKIPGIGDVSWHILHLEPTALGSHPDPADTETTIRVLHVELHRPKGD